MKRLIDHHGKICVLFDTRDFQGWNAGALWEDIKFNVGHFNDIERLIMVGEKKWQEWMSTFCKPFTTAKIRYFEQDEGDQTQEWLVGE